MVDPLRLGLALDAHVPLARGVVGITLDAHDPFILDKRKYPAFAMTGLAYRSYRRLHFYALLGLIMSLYLSKSAQYSSLERMLGCTWTGT